MFGLLIAVIYLSFVSLGLPDSLLGAAWPVMNAEMGVPSGYAGIITMVIGAGTIVSSLLSDKMTSRFGAGVVTAVSTLLTAVALCLFSIGTQFWMLVVFAVPYGLGAGGVDAALNNYVALHFKSRHMSWLHCMWGIGAAISPNIMGMALSLGSGWQTGYLVVAVIQFVLTAVIFASLPLWKRARGGAEEESAAQKQPAGAPEDGGTPAREERRRALPLKEVVSTRGAVACFVCFFCYCAVEQTAILWGATYMLGHNSFSPEFVAAFSGMFFIGISLGRGINGFLTIKFSDRTLIRAGSALIAAGVILISIPNDAATIAGFVVLGLGCAPVYPCIIHSTPALFGAEKSQAMIGMQMAFAYIGGLASPLFGALIGATSVLILPAYLAVFLAVMIAMHEIMVVRTAKNKI